MAQGVLTQKSSTEYELEERSESLWIGVKGFSVCIRATDEGVVADIFKKGEEDREALAGAMALDNDHGPVPGKLRNRARSSPQR